MGTDKGDNRVRYGYLSPYLDGVYLAVNALPDSYLVYDAHNCGYYKAEKIAGNHDLRSTLIRWDQLDRILRTNIESREFVMGSDDRLSKKLRQVIERYRPAVIFVASSNVMAFTGHDAGPVLRRMRELTEVPILALGTRHLGRDHVQGYLDTVAGVLDLITPQRPSADPRTVLLAGYLFERNEGDHRGNVAELERLVTAAGGVPSGVLLDGSPAKRIRELEAPGVVVDLATGWTAPAALAERCAARYLPLPPPVGIEPTARWLRALAAVLGTADVVEPFIEAEISALAQELRWVLPRLVGQPVVALADRLWLGPLVTLLEELGLDVRGVGCTSRGEHETAPLPDAPASAYATLPEEIPALLEHLRALRARGELALVIGNSYLHQLLEPLAVPYVDFGYPCNFHHVLAPAPTLGFAGVRTWAERLLNALGAPRSSRGRGPER